MLRELSGDTTSVWKRIFFRGEIVQKFISQRYDIRKQYKFQPKLSTEFSVGMMYSQARDVNKKDPRKHLISF